VKLSPAEAIERYRSLLARYHRTLDLMSERGLADVDRRLEEAERYLAVARRFVPEGGTVLDVGSGAGLPGVVLAAHLPRCRVVLSERRRKRVAFLRLVVGQLGLANTSVVEGDVAELRGLGAEVVVAQAVGTFGVVLGLTRDVAKGDAVWVSRKGPDWRQEVEAAEAEVGAALAVVAVEPLGHRGSLVALRFAEGPVCPSSA